MTRQRSFVIRSLWIVLRMALCAWVGAATLFVVSVVREVTTPFEMIVKNQLVALRFPVFYCFGFTLLGAGLGCSVVLACLQSRRFKALAWIATLCGLSLLLMLYDYCCVYRPLEVMVLSPKYVIPPEFFGFHQWSKWLNLVTALLCLIAGLISADERVEADS